MSRLWLLILVVTLTVSLWAQAPTGAITGTVTDESGAIVPNTKVTVVNKGTGASRESISGADGSFSASALPAGEYEVRAEAPGFRVLVRPATVETGATTTVNMAMQVGATKDVVTVQEAAASINYDANTVQGLISRQQIENLPLNGRSFLNLAQLEPGVTVAPGNPAQFNSQFNVSILGGASSHTAITIDGANVRNPVEGGTGQNFSQEIVQEFQLSAVNFDLSTGLTAFGAVNVVTRSGSNTLHGAGYFYFRDHNLGAYPTLNRNSLTNDPFFARRQSGFWLGGPIKKDKLFFFGNFEYTNQNGVYVVQPDLASLSNFASIAGAPYIGKQFSAKFDYRFNDKNTFSLRYSGERNSNSGPFGTPVPPSNFVSNRNWVDQYTMSFTSVLTPSLVNDFRFSYWYWQNRNVPAPCTGCYGSGGPEIFFAGVSSANVQFGNNFNSPQGRDLRRYPLSDNVNWQKGAHRIKFGGEWEFNRGTGYWGFFDPYRVYLLSPEFLRATLVAPGVTYAAALGVPASGPITAADIPKLPVVTYVLGVGVRDQPAPFQLDQARPNNRFHFYAQDTWKVTPKFTLNYGLGYVFESNLLNYDLQRPAYIAPLYGSNLGPPNKNKLDFSPALGFAWSPGNDQKTVIRGGFGIFYDTQEGWWRLGERASLGPNGRQFITVGTTAAPIPYGIFQTLFPSILAKYNAVLPGTPNSPAQITITKTAGALGALYPKDFPTLQAQHVNVGLQRQVAGNIVVTADFVYRHTLHQTPGGFFGGSVDYNHFNATVGPAIPTCPGAPVTANLTPGLQCSNGPINFWWPGGTAAYKALLVKVDKRFSNRYQFTASYALQYSDSINDISYNLFDYNASKGPDLPRHNLTISGTYNGPFGIKASVISTFLSRQPFVPFVSGFSATGSDTSSGGYAVLPGIGFNGFASESDIRKAVANWNANIAGTLTPAAQVGVANTGVAKGSQKFPTLTLPNNFSVGGPFTSQDLRLSKDFRIRERVTFQVLAEGFNILNIGNLSAYTTNILNGGFGTAQQRTNSTFGSGGPRAFQFAGRLSF